MKRPQSREEMLVYYERTTTLIKTINQYIHDRNRVVFQTVYHPKEMQEMSELPVELSP